MVLSHTVRSDWTSVVFTIIDLPREFVRVYAAAAQPMSQVAQTDFTVELVVSNLKLGIIGAPPYHCHADGQDSGRWRKAILTNFEVQLQVAKRAQELCKEERKAKRQKQEEEFNRECAKAIQESLNIFDAASQARTGLPCQPLHLARDCHLMLLLQMFWLRGLHHHLLVPGGAAGSGGGAPPVAPATGSTPVNINPARRVSKQGGPVNNPAAPVSNQVVLLTTQLLLWTTQVVLWTTQLVVGTDPVGWGESKALVQVSEVLWLCLEAPSQAWPLSLHVHSFRVLNPRPGRGQQRCRGETKEVGSTKLKVFGFSL